MTRIHLLDRAVADAIAAGEVVERPASVVKELCENALDAGARRIDVQVEGGGLVRIRVVDDGAGMTADDLPLAVARHATSKIAAVDDLFQVSTMGFRGEALASIAAVSDVVLVSRPAHADAGARLHVRAAEVVETGPYAAPPGTSVEVRDLFAATPARLRFLRNLRTESAACVRAAADVALCRPDVALTCQVDGRPVLASRGGNLREALGAVLGAEVTAEVLEVMAPGDVAVGGLISEPRVHRATRGALALVVNGRRVHNRALVVAVEEAYRGLLPQGRHPFGVVTVVLPAEEVDVNVHPTKREVRFRDEGRVFAAVQRACWHALGAARPYAGVGSPGLGLADGFSGATAAVPAPVAPAGDGGVGVPADTRRSPATPDGGAAVDVADGLASLAPLTALGQSHAGWLVAATAKGVVLVDPHAAHEKVLYARLAHAWSSPAGAASPSSQLLLLPVTVDVGADGVAALEDHAADIAALGFELAPFGPATVRCAAVPAVAGGADAVRLTRDLLESLSVDRRAASAERRHRLTALVACHAAVRLGEPMAGPEQQRLLDSLTVTPGGMTCPHGRPTVLVLSDADLRRAFRRT